jgi:hypothetical protein
MHIPHRLENAPVTSGGQSLDYKGNFGPRPRSQLPGSFDRAYF